MNKAQLSEKIAAKAGITKVQAESVLDAFVDITMEALKSGDEVTLTGFGCFSARRRKGREGINPRHIDQKIAIPSVVVAKFKAGKNLKEMLKISGKQVSATTPTTTVAA
ncbi:MAG: HU family DNA-binding protein [bacterium]